MKDRFVLSEKEYVQERILSLGKSLERLDSELRKPMPLYRFGQLCRLRNQHADSLGVALRYAETFFGEQLNP